MTITLRYIDGVGDLEARWAEIWPLLDALQTHYAGFLKRELRPGREERFYKHAFSGMENDDFWPLIVEEDGEIVAVGTASITANGRTQPDGWVRRVTSLSKSPRAASA